MGIPNIINIGDGTNGKIEYYYWGDYDTYEEAIYWGKKIKQEKKLEGIKMKYFIMGTQEGWFLPVPKYVLYFSKKMKILI